MPDAATKPEAWYHADFCHAFAWVYEDGDKLRVRSDAVRPWPK